MFAVLLQIAIIGAVVFAIAWVFITLASIRDGQRRLLIELDHLRTSLGIPARRQGMIVCPECRRRYQTVLTGCPACGAAKPEHAPVVLTEIAAADQEWEDR